MHIEIITNTNICPEFLMDAEIEPRPSYILRCVFNTPLVLLIYWRLGTAASCNSTTEEAKVGDYLTKCILQDYLFYINKKTKFEQWE